MNKPVTAVKADEYFEEAQEWEHDRIQAAKESARKAWMVAFIMAGIAALSALSNLFLFPLKEIETQIVRVDMATGIVDVQRCTDCKTEYNEVVDKYWLGLYVRAHEGFTFSEFDQIYKTVGLLSSQQEATRFFDYFRPENATAPVNLYGDRVKVKVKVRSVSFLDKGLATVRFIKIREQFGARPIETYWIATIKYRYVNAPDSEADREINPIGFQVMEWRVDPESDVEVSQ